MAETSQLITEYGILVVLAAAWMISSFLRDRREAKRLDTMEGAIAPAMHAVAEALQESAIEKRALKDIVEGNTAVVSNSSLITEKMILVYQKSMERVENDQEFFSYLQEELRAHGVQQEEILSIVRRLEQKHGA